MNKNLLLVFMILGVLKLISGHGMVLDPVNRASRWRFDYSAPTNYEDNELFCGGFQTQWIKNQGKCGFCGDNWALSRPRRNELGGRFGEGVIVRNYAKDTNLPISILITANHMGYFKFQLCDLDNELFESDECFEKYPLKTIDEDYKYVLPSTQTGWFNTTLTLPPGLTCKHCILQWTYVAGNSWGICNDGNGRLGCGPQENFRTCSDISIF